MKWCEHAARLSSAAHCVHGIHEQPEINQSQSAENNQIRWVADLNGFDEGISKNEKLKFLTGTESTNLLINSRSKWTIKDRSGNRIKVNMVVVKRPGFPNGEPESLYRHDSPWISSYHIQNSFQLDITDIQRWKSLHGFNYYITGRVVVRKSEYKPLGLTGNK